MRTSFASVTGHLEPDKDPSGTLRDRGRDTTGRLKSVQMTIEIESGLVLHLDVPVTAEPDGKDIAAGNGQYKKSNHLDKLAAAWPAVLVEIQNAVAAAKAAEIDRIKVHLEALR